MATTLWLAYWADRRFPALPLATHVAVFAGLAAASVLMSLARSVGLTAALLGAASSLHDGVLESVLRSPIAFFDATPVGRIINRFSKDQATLDSDLLVVLQACP